MIICRKEILHLVLKVFARNTVKWLQHVHKANLIDTLQFHVVGIKKLSDS